MIFLVLFVIVGCSTEEVVTSGESSSGSGPTNPGGDSGTDTNTILKGRVTIKGESPNKQIQLYLDISRDDSTEPQIEKSLITDTNGYYSVEIPDSLVGENLDILIKIKSISDSNYTVEQVMEQSLNVHTYTYLSPQNISGIIKAPELDLYGYNAKLISPADGANVSLPYNINIRLPQIASAEFNYSLFFYDTNGNYQGDTDWFFENSAKKYNGTMEYRFDGYMDDGSMINDNSVWYVTYAYNVNDEGWVYFSRFGYNVYLNSSYSYNGINTETVHIEPKHNLK